MPKLSISRSLTNASYWTLLMRLEIRSAPFSLTPALEARVRRRMRFALCRFQTGIRQVTVRLCDLNGPRGGVDKQCRIEAALRRGQTVQVEDVDADLYAAIDRAAGRLGRLIAHRQSLRLESRRRGGPLRKWMVKSRPSKKRQGGSR